MEQFFYKSFDGTKLPIEVYRENSDKKSGLIILFYGGAWRNRNMNHFRKMAEDLMEKDMITALLDYRVLDIDGTGLDIAIKDAIYGIESIICDLKDSLKVENIFLGGGSAGGHLALSSMLLNDFIPENFCYRKYINGLFLFNPVVDIVNCEKIDDAINKADCKRSEMCPMENMDKLPPTYIFHGSEDKTVAISSIYKFVQKSTNIGNEIQLFEFPDVGHGFFRYKPGQEQMYEDVLNEVIAILSEFIQN